MMMAGNGAKQSVLPSAAGSALLASDETAPKTENSLQDFKNTASQAAAGSVLPRAVRSNDFPNLKMLGMCLAVYLGVGTTCFYTLRDQIRGKKTNDLIDSIYLCVVTMTTVGYGDLVPHGIFSKLVATIFTVVGMCIVGVVVKIAATFLVDKQEMMVARVLQTCRKMGPVDALKEIENTKISYKKCLISMVVMLAHFLGGIFMLIGIEDMDFMEAFYCASTTMTTLGYGDETFATTSGRLFGIFWISSGTSCLGQLFLYLAEMYVEMQTKETMKRMLTTNFATNADLEAADYGNRASAFIIHKLKEMGKIVQEDISRAEKEFEDQYSAFKAMSVQSSQKK